MRTAANELRRKASALARFAMLLDSHRKALELNYAALARLLPSPRERSDGRAAANTVSNWCKGTALPTEIEPLLRALFGQDRNRNTEAREALRAAFNAAVAERHGAAVAAAAPAPAAAGWRPAADNQSYVHEVTGEPGDAAAAADPLHRQLQQAIRRMAAELAELAAARRARFGNYATWRRLPDAASALRDLVAREPEDLPVVLGDAYGLALELAGFVAADMRLQRDPMAADPPLDAEIHRPLSDLVGLLAPWLRAFPSVAHWDDEAGRLLARSPRIEDARDFTRAALTSRIVGEADAGRMIALAEAGLVASDGLAAKAGRHAAAEAYNLLLAVARLAAAALAGSLPTTQTGLARRSGATLAAAAGPVARFAEAQQADLRQALLALAEDGRRLERDGPAEPASAPAVAEPVPADVEEQALALILDGTAPPASWVPHLHRLVLPTGTFNRTDLLAGLTALHILDLAGTRVAELAPLAGLTALQALTSPTRGSPSWRRSPGSPRCKPSTSPKRGSPSWRRSPGSPHCSASTSATRGSSSWRRSPGSPHCSASTSATRKLPSWRRLPG